MAIYLDFLPGCPINTDSPLGPFRPLVLHNRDKCLLNPQLAPLVALGVPSPHWICRYGVNSDMNLSIPLCAADLFLPVVMVLSPLSVTGSILLIYKRVLIVLGNEALVDENALARLRF